MERAQGRRVRHHVNAELEARIKVYRRRRVDPQEDAIALVARIYRSVRSVGGFRLFVLVAVSVRMAATNLTARLARMRVVVAAPNKRVN